MSDVLDAQTVRNLIDSNNLFHRLFESGEEYDSFSTEDREEMEKRVEESRPGCNLRSEWHKYRDGKIRQNLNPEEECGESLTFDPGSQRYVKNVFAAKKKREREFDGYQFIIENQREGTNLSMGTDEDVLHDFLMCKRLVYEGWADQCLRKIAKMVLDLDRSCKYKLLELHYEKD